LGTDYECTKNSVRKSNVTPDRPDERTIAEL